MSVQVSYKKQFIFFILLILIFAVMVEVILHVLDITPKNCYIQNSSLYDDLSEDQKQKLCDELTRMGGAVTRSLAPIPLLTPNQQGGFVNINSDGFRGEEFNFSEKDYKIFFLGGSTIFGVGSLSDETTIPRQVEKKLQEKGYDVKVINAGIPAATTLDELYLLDNFLLKYNPDMIVTYDGYNDAGGFNLRKFHIPYEEFVNNNAGLNNMPHTKENITSTKGSGIIKLLEQINYKTGLGIITYYKNFINTSDIPVIPVSKDMTETDPKILHFIENYMMTNWSKICSLGTSSGFQVVNIIQPILGTSDRIISYNEKEVMSEDRFQNRFLTYLKEIDLDYGEIKSCENIYDLRNTFVDMDGVQIYYDEGHMSDFGNVIIAEKITEKIIPLIENDLS